MANMNALKLGAVGLATILIGGVIGSFTAKQVMSLKKEHTVIKTAQKVVVEPNKFAQRVDFSIDKREMPLIIEKLDYNKVNKGKPMLAYVRRDKTVEDADTHKKYVIPGESFLKIVAYTKGDYLKVEAKTDKDEIVELTMKKIDVEIVDAGQWQRIKFKDGNTGWIEKI